MASIVSGSIDLTKIDKSKIYEGKKGKYYPITVVLLSLIHISEPTRPY